MHRPPRDARKDRLVTLHLISHSYLIVGVVATFAGFLAYMAVLNDYGYTPNVSPLSPPLVFTFPFSLHPFLSFSLRHLALFYAFLSHLAFRSLLILTVGSTFQRKHYCAQWILMATPSSVVMGVESHPTQKG